jgi:hypothetical protein
VQCVNAAILIKALVEDSSKSHKHSSHGEYFTHWETILIHANKMLVFVKSQAEVILNDKYTCVCFQYVQMC